MVEVEGRGRDAISDVRTSYGMFFERGESDVLRRVESRLSAATMIPVGHGEGVQVLRYQNGQEYKPHFDYFFREQWRLDVAVVVVWGKEGALPLRRFGIGGKRTGRSGSGPACSFCWG